MRKNERRQLQAVLKEMKCKIKTEVLTDLLDKAVSHALMETVYMRCNQLHQRIVMALHEIRRSCFVTSPKEVQSITYRGET